MTVDKMSIGNFRFHRIASLTLIVVARKSVEDGLDWLSDELKQRSMNREDLERAGGPLAASLANAYRRKKVGKGLAAQIATGLNMPDEVVYREFGLLPEKQVVDDEEAQILAGLLNDIPDSRERKQAFSLAQMVIRHFAKGGAGKSPERGKSGGKGRHSAASH
jgi:hypothetical protein